MPERIVDTDKLAEETRRIERSGESVIASVDNGDGTVTLTTEQRMEKRA